MKTIITFLIAICSINIAFAQNGIIINNSDAKLFEQIPDGFIQNAINSKIMFRHASVGTTINGGLECLQGTRNNCKMYPMYKYNRNEWKFIGRGNSGWYGKLKEFELKVNDSAAYYDIFFTKYCYLDGLDETAEPCGKYPQNPAMVKKAWDSLRVIMERLEIDHPTKKFIWITIPLTQVGQHCTDTLNKLIRDYCIQNRKILFDIADIESHDTVGNAYKSNSGLEIAYKPHCGEQKPDAVACHPNSTGGLILAKAFWVMIAKINGWEPATNIIEDKVNPILIINPNPTSEFIEVVYRSNFSEQFTLDLYSLLGEKLLSIKARTDFPTRIDISHLLNGAYYIRAGEIIKLIIKN